MLDNRAPIRFGDFVFDPATGELTSGETTSRLAPQVAAVLDLLTMRAGDVVTRAELRAELWPDTTVEFDQGLNFCIRQLRIALSDDAAQPRYIETLPRRGYRFLAPIEPTAPSIKASAEVPARTEASAPFRRRPWPQLAIVGTVALGLVLLAASRLGRGANTQPSIAVLRFDVVPPDSSLERYRLSMAEQIVTSLSRERPSELAVMGPTFTARFPGMQTEAESLRTALGARYSLSGALRRTPAGIRVFAQLIRLDDRRHVYAVVLFDSSNTGGRLTAIADSIAGGTRSVIASGK